MVQIYTNCGALEALIWKRQVFVHFRSGQQNQTFCEKNRKVRSKENHNTECSDLLGNRNIESAACSIWSDYRQ